MRKLLCILFFWLVASLHCTGAVPIRSYNFPFADELPSNEMTDIYQDDEGFVWIGTTNGLARYDGHGIRTFRADYRHPDLLTHNRINSISGDTHYIYIGTPKGLNVYDRQSHRIQPFRHPMTDNAYISVVYADGNGGVWMSGGACLYQVDVATRSCRTYRLFLKDGYTPVVGNTLFIDRDKRLWLCSRNGLIRYDDAAGRFIRYPAIGRHNNPFSMFQDRDGRYWVMTWGEGLWQMMPGNRVDGTTYRHQPLDNARTHIPDELFFSMAQDDVCGYLWVLSYNGLYALRRSPESGLFEPVDISGDVDINKMYTRIIKDHDGNLWLSSYDQGTLITFPSERIGNFHLSSLREDLQWAPNLLTLGRDGDGNCWFNQDRFGICLLPAGGRRVIYASPELCRLTMDARVMAACPGGNGIWLGDAFSPYVYELRYHDGRIVRTATIDLRVAAGIYEPVRQLACTSDSLLWMLAQGRVMVRNRHTGAVILTSGPSQFLRFIQAADATVWGVTAGERIYELEGGKNTIALHDTGVRLSLGKNENATQFCADSNGGLWLGTSQGRILRVDIRRNVCADRTADFNQEGGSMLNLLSYGRMLWLITHNKIIRYDTERGVTTYYPVSDDFMTVRIFRDQAACIDSNGILYAGGTGGFVSIAPSRADGKSDDITHPIVLADIRVNGESYSLACNGKKLPDGSQPLRLRLPHTARNIDIDFTTLHALTQHSFRYEFKMEGTDERWVQPESGTHTAFYNKLGKGHHRFWVRYAGKSGEAAGETLLADIYVEPAWWETRWAYLLYTFVVLVAVLLSARVYVVRLKRKNERLLRESITQTKLDYFTNMSHELLTPLSVISCVADYWDENYPGERHQSGIMRNHIRRLKHLLQQVLDFRKVENGQMTLKVRYTHITAFLRQAGPDNLLPLARQKQLGISTHLPDEDVWGYLDEDKVDKMLYNLLSNAIKYTPALKNIDFTAEIRVADGIRWLALLVRDEGVGIPQKEQQRIFSRFYTGSNGRSGASNGIGLALTKDMAELHHGSVTVESRPGKGSLFTIILPIDREAYRDEELERDCIEGRQTVQADETVTREIVGGGERSTVLLVDDNIDLLDAIRRLFAPYYEVVAAGGGNEALTLLEHTVPDIIVSDVMMPEPDGFAFCRLVKSQVSTSHIPVILLTAKCMPDDRVEAYNAGADGYLAKPFEAQVLKARIDNLLRTCRERQQAFRAKDRIQLNELEYQAEDTLFLQKLTDYIHAHLDDEECSLEQLAGHTNMSKSTLNRKVKAMTGMTPSDFVRNIKLKYACMMLEHRNAAVSEVAYATGFSSPKYFTKCFKKEFGITPTGYQQQKSTEKQA